LPKQEQDQAQDSGVKLFGVGVESESENLDSDYLWQDPEFCGTEMRIDLDFKTRI